MAVDAPRVHPARDQNDVPSLDPTSLGSLDQPKKGIDIGDEHHTNIR